MTHAASLAYFAETLHRHQRVWIQASHNRGALLCSVPCSICHHEELRACCIKSKGPTIKPRDVVAGHRFKLWQCEFSCNANRRLPAMFALYHAVSPHHLTTCGAQKLRYELKLMCIIRSIPYFSFNFQFSYTKLFPHLPFLLDKVLPHLFLHRGRDICDLGRVARDPEETTQN